MTQEQPVSIQTHLLRIIEVTYWIAIAGIPILAWLLPLNWQERVALVALAAVSAIFAIIIFRWIARRYAMRYWLNYVILGITVAIVGVLSFILAPYGIHFEFLYLALIASLGVLAGRRPAYYAVVATVIVESLVNLLQLSGETHQGAVIALQVLVLGLAGWLTAEITSLIYQNLDETGRKNRHLLMLLQVGQAAATIFSTDSEDDMQTRLSRIAEIITREVPVTACRILLLNPAHDTLKGYGAYPIRPLNGWEVGIGQSYQLANLPKIRRAIRDGRMVILDEQEITALIEEQDGPGFFFYGVKMIAALPLTTQGEVVGILVAGESRQPQREPFNQAKIDLLMTLANQVAAAVKNAQLLLQTRRQAQRLQVLNEVGRAIGSTIELEQLLELIYQQLSAIIATDTYYVSLHDADENLLDMHILYDDGVRFPRTRVPVGQGLAYWIIQSRKPLLIRHMTAEWDSLPVHPIQLGQDRMSESWLGVPIVSGARVLGTLAVASYTPNAFGQEDVNLLENIAAQAALAIDNAHQHEAVKEQARRDSLTEAYNHGYFLRLLNEAVEQAQAAGEPVALIMLDIDLFKHYNDVHGHAVGDQVLCQLVQAIQEHVERRDPWDGIEPSPRMDKVNGFVGRWGGEEFGIGLPGATLAQAAQVAELVRQTLRDVHLSTRDGQPVAPPTVSQGVAAFPQQAGDAAELVDIADAALYRAKGAGRDQVVLAD